MRRDTRVFIDALFARCTIPAYLTLTALPHTHDRATPSRHILLGDDVALDDALERLQAANQLGWSACIAVATRTHEFGRWRRGGKTDLAELPALFVDIDHAEHMQECIASFPLPPSCMVSSGHGRHLYWYLSEPTRAWDTAERILHELAHRLNGDPVMSVAQSMRLPGTVNTKPGRGGALCHILEHHPERHYSLAAFTSLLGKSLWARDYDFKQQRISSSRDRCEVSFSDVNPALVDAVVQRLVCDYGGRMKENGWLAACCPCGHAHDAPGAHFGFNPAWGIGVCFGRHGRLRLIDLCPLLGIDWRHYGWLTREGGKKQAA